MHFFCIQRRNTILARVVYFYYWPTCNNSTSATWCAVASGIDPLHGFTGLFLETVMSDILNAMLIKTYKTSMLNQNSSAIFLYLVLDLSFK